MLEQEITVEEFSEVNISDIESILNAIDAFLENSTQEPLEN
ncbi:MAG: hypothetical protein OQJ97_14985 [Rhodospirillales bacterium]|nr:hypothetical protein [Rhodospirillales bacterium]